MLPTIVALILIVLLAIAVVAMVVVGMEGAGRHRIPEVAHTLARAGKHLNGEADPPAGLVAFFEEVEDSAEALRRRTASARSALSAKSASTARSARTAISARSAASARSATRPDEDQVERPSVTSDASPAPRTWAKVADPAVQPTVASVTGEAAEAAAPASSNAWTTWTAENS